MKKQIFVAVLFLLNLLVFSQHHEVFYNVSGDPVFVRWGRTDTVYNFSRDEVQSNGLSIIENGNSTLLLDARLPDAASREDDYAPSSSELMNNFDPSTAPNGDFIEKIAYTPDGELIAVLQRHSDNLVLYNSNSFEIEEIIDLSRNPMDMVVTDDYIYVCCYTAKEIQIIDLSNYSVISAINVMESPCQIEINFEDSIAYVAMDYKGQGSNQGGIAAYDLQSGGLVFETSDPQIYLYGRSGKFGRLGERFRKFYLSPDGSKIIAPKAVLNETGIYDALNGELLKTFNAGSLAGAGFSGSGDTLYISTEKFPSTVFSVYRVDMETLNFIDSIVASTVIFTSVVDLAVNPDGSKVLSSGDALNNHYLFFDFNSHQYQSIPAASINGNFDLVLKTSDRNYAIMFSEGLYDIVDLNTGQVVASSEFGTDYGWEGAISPSGNKLFLSDGVCSHHVFDYYGERMYAMDISDLSAPLIDTILYAGNASEADETSMAWLTNDGKKFVAANPLSHNISVVDIETGLTDTLIHYENLSGLKTIPGKNEAIAYSENGGTLGILDLDTYEFVAHIDVGEVNHILVSGDGQYTYILDYYTYGGYEGMLTKVRLDGALSTIDDQITVNIHDLIYWNLNTGVIIQGVPALSPDGKYLLSSIRSGLYDYYIGIIDVERMELVASLPTDSHAFSGFAFTDDSRWALCQTCDYSVPIVYLDGEDSFISSSFPLSYSCLSAAYNPVDGLFYVLQDMYHYSTVDPETGAVVNTVSTGQQFQYNIKIDKDGNPVVLTTSNLIYKGEAHPVIGTAIEMNYYSDRDIFVIAVPGPDKIVSFGDLAVNIPEVEQFVSSKAFDIIPNPANETVQIRADFYINKLEIIDLAGKYQFAQDVDAYDALVNVNRLKSGIYFVRLFSGEETITQKLVRK